MTLVRYVEGNPVGSPRVKDSPILNLTGGATFNIFQALRNGNGSFTVDDQSQVALVAALDGDPRVQRAGGEGAPSPPNAQAGVIPVVVIADASGHYAQRPGAPFVIWIGPTAPATGVAQDGDLWFNSNLAITV